MSAASPPNIAGMRKFIAARDRNPPLAFAGREDVIAELRATAEAVALRHAEGDANAGMTQVVQGPPGVGKSALLHEVHKCSAGWHPAPAVVRLTVRCLHDQRYLAERLIEQMELGEAVEALAARVRARTPTAGVNTVLRGGVDLRDERHLPPPSDVLTALGKTLCAGGRPLLLLVDEAQRLALITDPGAVARAMDAVQDLHDGTHRLPVVTVYAGLSPTAGALGDMGVSRGSIRRCVELDRLVPEESLAVALGTLRALHVAGSTPELERWARSAVAASDDWPQHLTNTLAACCRELLEHDGDAARGDLGRAIRDAVATREESYVARRRALDRTHHALGARAIGACMARGTLDRDGLVGALLHALRNGAPDVSEEDAPAAAGALFNNALHCGMLRETAAADGTYECPIPSFRTHLERYAARPAVHGASGGPRS